MLTHMAGLLHAVACMGHAGRQARADLQDVLGALNSMVNHDGWEERLRLARVVHGGSVRRIGRPRQEGLAAYQGAPAGAPQCTSAQATQGRKRSQGPCGDGGRQALWPGRRCSAANKQLATRALAERLCPPLCLVVQH